MTDPIRALVLGGTAEARSLCAALARMPGLVAIASLAGATRSPAQYDVPTRSGGFGGVEGLARYLTENRIDALMDATHPFAQTIAGNAAEAARITGIRHLKLIRPPWQPAPSERWRDIPDFASAAKALPRDARVFLATGAGSVRHFPTLTLTSVVLRVTDSKGRCAVPCGWTILAARPPFTVDSEKATFSALGVTHLVTRNAGGDEGRAKLDAAAAMGLEVVMIARPDLPEGIDSVPSVAAARDWLRGVARGARTQLDTLRGA